ncbi:MAG: hypothetical protein ACPGLY_05950 [Rubripirellula sp.]
MSSSSTFVQLFDVAFGYWIPLSRWGGGLVLFWKSADLVSFTELGLGWVIRPNDFVGTSEWVALPELS